MTAIIIFLLCASFSVPVIISVVLFRDLRGHMEMKISQVNQKNGELLLLIKEMKDQLDIQKVHQEAMVRRIIDWSQKHNKLATVFEEHGHGLLDEDTMQPMAHSTTPVSLVELLQRMMSQAGVTPDMDLD